MKIIWSYSYNKTDDKLFINQIKKQIHKEYSKISNFDSAMITFSKNYKDVFPYEIDIEKGDYVILSNKTFITKTCRIVIFFKEFFFECVVGILLLLGLAYLLLLEYRKQSRWNLAQILYKCIVLDIQNYDKVIKFILPKTIL